MKIYRTAAFSQNGAGGNPAGVVVLESSVDSEVMQRVAREVGYSETAFLLRTDGVWRTRYFAPSMEIPFCGHATIAAGSVLGSRFGAGDYVLQINAGEVPVQTYKHGEDWSAAFVSPPTYTRSLDVAHLERLLECFGLIDSDLDPHLPPMLMNAGANHVLIALAERRRLSHLGYAFNELLAIQRELELATVSVVVREGRSHFHARNPFAIGGVYEDPATGAAAAALAGYLRDMDIIRSGEITVQQGEDMGVPSRIVANFSEVPGSGVRVSGETRVVQA